MSTALAPSNEDEENNNLLALEEDPAKIKHASIAKVRITALREDAERKTDYQARLKRKLHKLDQDLADQRELVESLERTLLLERQRDAQDEKSRKIEADQRKAIQEDKIRNQLQEVLYAKLPGKGSKKNYLLDTVLISFIRPNENIRYKLPFRVDKDTTLKHLLEDACKYWEVPESEFILKTMANSKCQNEIKVQDCFKQGEIAQLRLEHKNREQTEVTEAEEKAIQPKIKNKKKIVQDKNYSDLGEGLLMQHNGKYFDQLKQLGGVYFLCRLREPKPTEHWNKIKLRDMIIYTLLAVVTFATYYYQRQPGESYWFLKGIEDSFLTQRSRSYTYSDFSKSVPPFTEIKTYEEVWDWLQITLPGIVWGTDYAQRTLTSYNVLTGYLNIRTKNVKSTNPVDWNQRFNLCPKSKQFDVQKILDILPGAQCTPAYVNPETEETEMQVPLDRYWAQVLAADDDSDLIRGPGLPYQFVSADENKKKANQHSVAGGVQFYDAAGYSVNYKAQLPPASVDQNVGFYQMDMEVFRTQHWININTTRAVIVAMNIYNYNYDKWASLELLAELPISGQVVTKMILREFSPNLTETRGEMYVLYAYFGRLAIAFYIFFFVGSTEIRHLTKQGKAGILYYCSFCGIMDVSIVILCCGAVFWRYLRFRDYTTADILRRLEDPAKTIGFQSFGQNSFEFEALFIVEGFLFAFTMFRLIALARFNRTVYLMWRIIGEAMMGGSYFAVVFVATYWGFVVVGLKIWGESLTNFQNLSNAALSVFHLGRGTLDFTEMIKHDILFSVIYYIAFYTFVTFLLINGFAMIFVEAYYMIMLTSSLSEVSWDSQRWKSWFIHPVVLALYQYFGEGELQTV